MLLPSYKKTNTNVEFFGRESLLENFIINLNKVEKNSIDLIMYYGIGGIGKSTLINKLYSQYTNNNYKVKINLEESYNIEKFYSNLIKELNKQNIDVFNLKIAFSIYWNKLNPNTSMKENKMFDSPEWDGIISIVDTVGFGLGSIFKSISNSAHNIKSFSNKYKSELEELESMSPNEIEDQLPKFFEYDLANKLNEKNECLIFFIDTYEYLYENNKKEINKLSSDKFIRDIVLSTYSFKTLFVLAGREKLIWNKESEEWDNYINHINISSFTTEEAKQFLLNNNVKEDIANIISVYTEGVPFYLNLELNTYNKLEDPKPSDFKNNNTKVDIFNRFILYTNDIDLQLLKILSLTNYFDIDLFEKIIKEFNIPISILMFEDFVKSSYIKEDNNRYYIHNLMKKSISETLNKNIRKRINEFLFNYYNKDIYIQVDYAFDLYSQKDFKLYINNTYENNKNTFYILEKFLLKIKSNYLNSLETIYQDFIILKLCLLYLEYDNENMFFNEYQEIKNIVLRQFIIFIHSPEKNKNLIPKLSLNKNDFFNIDINAYTIYLIETLNIYRKQKDYDIINNNIIPEINNIISNNLLNTSTLYKYSNKLSIYYKDIKKYDLALLELEKNSKLNLNGIEQGTLFRNYALIYDTNGLNDLNIYKDYMLKALDLYDKYLKVFNERSKVIYILFIKNNIHINNIYFLFYKEYINNNNINEDNLNDVINFIQNDQDIVFKKNLFNIIINNLYTNKKYLNNINQLFNSILSSVEDNQQEFFQYMMILYYILKK